MPQYDNPASFLADPSEFQSGGMPNFMSGVVAGQRQQQAAPFLQELLKQQQMNTQQQATELGEFQSPLAVKQRENQRQKIIDEGDVFHQTMGDTVALSHEKAKVAPYLSEEQIANAKKNAVLATHETASLPVQYMSGVASQLEKIPEEARPAAYESALQVSGFNRSTLPPDLQTYQPADPKVKGSGTLSHLMMARQAMIESIPHIQKLQEETIPAEASKEAARIGVRGRLAEMGMQIDAGKFDNMPRYRIYLNKILSTGIDPETKKKVDPQQIEEARSALRRANWMDLQDRISKDPLVQGSSIMAMTGQPEAIQRAQAIRAEREQHHMLGMGLTPQDFGAGGIENAPQNQNKKITVQGATYDVLGTNKDGSMKIRDPKTGRTGIYRPK